MIHLSRDLNHLKRRILEMGGMVEAQTDKAITSILERRGALAEEVIAGDTRVDAVEVEVEEECLKVLALHQPFAQDLRFIITVLKVNNDLERIADLAVNIANRAAFLSTEPELGIDLGIELMADRVRRMVRQALDALLEQDTARARNVLVADEEVDTVHRELFDEVETLMIAHPEWTRRLMSYLSTSRYLERIADLATNIAEDVVFLVDGEVIRHREIVVRD
jgi:phosphate transport system protein